MTLVDLLHQVQKWLPVRYGGTGNPHGWATDALLGAYVNGTGSTITRGTLVQLANYTTVGGGHIADSRIKPTTTAAQQNVLGVVMGRYRTDEPANEFEDADCEDGDVCAVVISGKAFATVEGTVAVDQFAYSAATDGAASGADYLQQGGVGTWESAGTDRQWLRLWGATATPGVVGSILVVFGDGIAPIAVGTMVDVVVPFNLRFTDWTLLSTITGDISIDIYSSTYGAFPPVPSATICNSVDQPEITSGTKAQADVPYWIDVFGFPQGWDRDQDAGTVLRFNVESCTSITQVSLLLKYVRR